MTEGLTCVREAEESRSPSVVLQSCACVLLFYLALWGCVSSMAAVSAVGAGPLVLGGVLSLAWLVAPQNRRTLLWLAGIGGVLALLLFLSRGGAAWEGIRLLLNRLFLASEARQAYLYEKFPVSVSGERNRLQAAFLFLGVVSGMIFGAAFRLRLRFVLTAAVLAFSWFAAWLGLSPATGWMVALAAACVLVMILPAEGGGSPVLPGEWAGAVLVLCCALVLLLWPGEHTWLSAWDEQVRDWAALETAAYAQVQQARELQRVQEASREEQEPFREEETDADADPGEILLLRRWPLLLAILLAAVALFVPSVLHDRWRRRRARNRAGLEDPDNRTCVMAEFLYSLRWLRLGGLAVENRPYGALAAQVEERFSPRLREAYEQALLLWREAAYSEHPLDEGMRSQMNRFRQETVETVWSRLNKRERLWAKLWMAL